MFNNDEPGVAPIFQITFNSFMSFITFVNFTRKETPKNWPSSIHFTL